MLTSIALWQPQYRDRIILRQAQITVLNAKRFNDARQETLSTEKDGREAIDQRAEALHDGSAVQESRQAANAALQRASYLRSANNETQAGKVVLSQMAETAYREAQMQRKFLSTVLGYA